MARPARLPLAGAVALALAGVTAPGLGAQVPYSCNPLPAEANETKLLGFFATPLAFSAIEQPQRVPTGLTTLVLEVANVPTAGDDIRRTQCFAADKSQNANLASLMPRPRLIIGLPWGMHLEGTYLPPITVGNATPNLVQGALAWTGRLGTFAGNGLRLQLRGHMTRGTVEGPITCDEQALRPDPTAPCYGRQVSADKYRPDMIGAEALLAVDGPGYGYYIGSGVTSLDAGLDVVFDRGAGIDPQPFRDRSRVRAPRQTQVPLLIGGTLRFTPTIALLGQYYIVLDQTSLFRFGIGWRPFGRAR